MVGRLAVALVHGPVLDRHGGLQTTALTNLDVHDIARSGRTYGCGAFYVVTPVEAQRTQAKAIVGFWEGAAGLKRNKDRTEAMSRVVVVDAVADAVAKESAFLGRRPLIVATSAKPQGAVSYVAMRERLEAGEHVLVLFGTGHGLAQSVLDVCDVVLAPVVGPVDDDGQDFNHLSVRSAAAIILDRLRGS
ncbi:MAG: RNA methyltransferase [Deltaproteobacteria bacterium]|nr:RNA methyltransferase [Deltaproteobacteria bacterium]